MREKYRGNEDDAPGIFARMDPMPGAIEAFHELAQKFDTYILSTAPWGNPSAWRDKLEWVQEHLGVEDGTPAYKRLILSHYKHLNHGDFLVDDRAVRGEGNKFNGEWVQYGSDDFPSWPAVTDYLTERA